MTNDLAALSEAATKEATEVWEKCCLADLYYKPFGEPDLCQTPVGIIAAALSNARAGRPVLIDHGGMRERVAEAMRNATISDDEGEFPRLFDLLDFSGENKAHTVTYGLADAAIAAILGEG